ncbi:unnamed protein product [Fraxinus pennsylvanica]|uniref:Ribosomal protein L27 n=1 Tax=Fraxinus pennsylvanica TaxID=56036 RepID=A0AAD1YYM3_9LAMI|nr:unnamed protein product [Fraxinus pennsylvanica]
MVTSISKIYLASGTAWFHCVEVAIILSSLSFAKLMRPNWLTWVGLRFVCINPSRNFTIETFFLLCEYYQSVLKNFTWLTDSFVEGEKAGKMPLGLIMGIGRAFRRKRTSSLDILTSKRSPRGYYKGKNCKPTGFHTRKGGYVVVPEKLPNYVVPDLTDFKLKPYVSQCAREVTEAAESAK